MKQNITLKQLRELSPYAKVDYIKFIKPEVGGICDTHKGWFYAHDYISNLERKVCKECLPGLTIRMPLISIGQMIEFLNENSKLNWEIRFHNNLVDINYPDSKISPDFEDCKELKDALWNIVKEVLEK